MTENDPWHLHKPPARISSSQQPAVLSSLADYPFKSVALATTQANLTGLWRYWRPFYEPKRAPCDAACPLGNQVVDYIQAALEGHWQAAANLLRAENPLPAVTGRVCHRPCELACNRRQYDERIAIHDIEATLAQLRYELPIFPAAGRAGELAVLGSGPAELAFAHFMALLGHRVTLFDAAELGGRLRHGGQARQFPPGLLDAEIERILAGRIAVRRHSPRPDAVEPECDLLFGLLDDPQHLVLRLPPHAGPNGRPERALLALLLGEEGRQGPAAPYPLRVSEAIGYGKWVALLLDAAWRGLDPKDVLAQIQVGGNARILSALKYLALLTGHRAERSEQVVTYDLLHLDMLDPGPPPDAALAVTASALLTTAFASAADLERLLGEAARCLSCGRCNHCDNCWVYCPDAAVSRDGQGYAIDYDYCKGCLVCAAVCPRRVLSVIEEEKWQRDSG